MDPSPKIFSATRDVLRELRKPGPVYVYAIGTELPVRKAAAIDHVTHNPCVLRVWPDGYRRLDECEEYPSS